MVKQLNQTFGHSKLIKVFRNVGGGDLYLELSTWLLKMNGGNIAIPQLLFTGVIGIIIVLATIVYGSFKQDCVIEYLMTQRYNST